MSFILSETCPVNGLIGSPTESGSVSSGVGVLGVLTTETVYVNEGENTGVVEKNTVQVSVIDGFSVGGYVTVPVISIVSCWLDVIVGVTVGVKVLVGGKVLVGVGVGIKYEH